MKENLYHFTSRTNIKDILLNGLKFRRNDLYSKNFSYYYTISTTRYYKFGWVRNGCRIVLDKSAIIKKYTIKPVHWNNIQNKQWLTDQGNDTRTDGHATLMNQFEERICFNPKDVYSTYHLPPKYIKQIDVLESDKDLINSLQNPYNIKIVYHKSVDDYKPIKEMKHIKTYNQIFESTNYDEYILPKGSILYHGTVENIKGELGVGDYDKILWAAKDKIISKMYIPDSSTTIYTSTRILSRPNMDDNSPTNNFLKSIGLIYYDVEFKNNRASSYGLKYTGDAEYLNGISENYHKYWNEYYKLSLEYEKLLDEYKKMGNDDENITDEELENSYRHISDIEDQKNDANKKIPNVENELLKYINRKIEELGYVSKDKELDKSWRLKEDSNNILRADYRSEGSLYQLTAKQDIKFYDMTKDSEADLTDLQYHKLGTFRKAEESGYNGVKIHDFAQSEYYGNYAHLSYGVFKDSIKLFDVKFIEKAYHPNQKELQ